MILLPNELSPDNIDFRFFFSEFDDRGESKTEEFEYFLLNILVLCRWLCEWVTPARWLCDLDDLDCRELEKCELLFVISDFWDSNGDFLTSFFELFRVKSGLEISIHRAK